MKPAELHFFIDANRCIDCHACVQLPGACSECDTHCGESMIHLEHINRASSVQTVPWRACTASSRRVPRCAQPMRSSVPATVIV